MPLDWWKVRAIGRNDLRNVDDLMPKLGSMDHAVFFLYGLDPKTGELVGPLGTGFFVHRRAKTRQSYDHIYGVTNWHLARDAGASIIRVNGLRKRTADPYTSRFIELDPSEWHCPNDGDDLAIIDLTELVSPSVDDIIALEEDIFITQKILEDFQIGPGEDTFMCGLLANHHGGETNAPVLRFGNIARMPSENSPLETATGAKLPCFLVDTRSRGGFSGSPVFSYRTREGYINGLPYGFDRGPRVNLNPVIPKPDYFWGLLGIHCSQFLDAVEVATNDKKRREIGLPIKDGDNIYIQSGMTVVIPAWRISQFLDAEVFEMTRKKHEDEWEPQSRQRPQAEKVSKPGPLSDDENPNHSEDFNLLLNKSAKAGIKKTK